MFDRVDADRRAGGRGFDVEHRHQFLDQREIGRARHHHEGVQLGVGLDHEAGQRHEDVALHRPVSTHPHRPHPGDLRLHRRSARNVGLTFDHRCLHEVREVAGVGVLQGNHPGLHPARSHLGVELADHHLDEGDRGLLADRDDGVGPFIDGQGGAPGERRADRPFGNRRDVGTRQHREIAALLEEIVHDAHEPVRGHVLEREDLDGEGFGGGKSIEESGDLHQGPRVRRRGTDENRVAGDVRGDADRTGQIERDRRASATDHVQSANLLLHRRGDRGAVGPAAGGIDHLIDEGDDRGGLGLLQLDDADFISREIVLGLGVDRLEDPDHGLPIGGIRHHQQGVAPFHRGDLDRLHDESRGGVRGLGLVEADPLHRPFRDACRNVLEVDEEDPLAGRGRESVHLANRRRDLFEERTGGRDDQRVADRIHVDRERNLRLGRLGRVRRANRCRDPGGRRGFEADHPDRHALDVGFLLQRRCERSDLGELLLVGPDDDRVGRTVAHDAEGAASVLTFREIDGPQRLGE